MSLRNVHISPFVVCAVRQVVLLKVVSLRSSEDGNQKGWLATFRQGAVGVVHRHGADRSTFSGTGSGTGPGGKRLPGEARI